MADQLFDDGDPRFRSAFSRAVADALLERERRERDQVPSPGGGDGRVAGGDEDESAVGMEAEACHRSLCFDDPVAPSDHALRSLASALTDRFGEDGGGTSGRVGIGLSDRLVDGIVEATSRHRGAGGAPSGARGEDGPAAPPPTSRSPRSQSPPPSPHGTTALNSAATAAGYAELAFAAFAAGPLGVLRDLRLGPDGGSTSDDCGVAARSFLGSYSGEMIPDVPEEGEGGDVAAPAVPAVESHDADDDDVENDDDDDDSLREIFAEESDPDDYEFESGYAYGPDRVDCYSFPPLSPPSATSLDPLTRRDALLRVRSLLSHLTYPNVVSAIATSRWGAVGGSRILADLTMELLSLSEEEEECEGGCLDDEDGVRMGVLESEWPRVAFLLRDRALDRTAGHDDVLGDALSLVRELLTREGGQNSMSLPSPCQSVALLLLSSLCSSADLRGSPRTRSQLLHFVLSPRSSTTAHTPSASPMLDLLSEVTEAVRTSAPPSNDGEGVATVVFEERLGCVASIAELVAGVGVDSDGSLERDDWWGNVGKKEAVEGALLSSGYLRELVPLCIRCWAREDVTGEGGGGGGGATGDEGGPTEPPPRPPGGSFEAARRRLLFALFATCVRSEAACTYAVRVPGFASDVLPPLLRPSCRRDEGLRQSTPPLDSDAVLWSILCARHHGGHARDALLWVRQKKNKTKQRGGGVVLDDVDLVYSLDGASVCSCTALCERASSSLSSLAHLRAASSAARRGSGSGGPSRGEAGGGEGRGRRLEETGRAATAASIALGDLVRFGRCMDTCPALARSWATSLASFAATGGEKNDGRFLVESRRGLSDVRDALLFATTPSPAPTLAVEAPSNAGGGAGAGAGASPEGTSSSRGGERPATSEREEVEGEKERELESSSSTPASPPGAGGGALFVAEDVLAAARRSVKVLSGIVLEAEQRRQHGDRDGAGAGTLPTPSVGAGGSIGGISSKTD